MDPAKPERSGQRATLRGHLSPAWPDPLSPAQAHLFQEAFLDYPIRRLSLQIPSKYLSYHSQHAQVRHASLKADTG